jgi:hypothetical protein
MATAYPTWDRFDVNLLKVQQDAEYVAYGGEGGVATDDEIRRLYVDGFHRPRVCALMRDVKSGRWGLGTTLVEIADWLDTDHTAISRALRWGDLSSNLEGYLMACPGRPADWEEPIEAVRAARCRNGFLAVADYLAGRMQAAVWSKTGFLREIHAEFLFDLIGQRERWTAACDSGDPTVAHELIVSVCDDPRREVLPFWYTKERDGQISRLIKRLRDDVPFAFRYLCMLQRRWEGAFVLTWAAVEGKGWVDLMD